MEALGKSRDRWRSRCLSCNRVNGHGDGVRGQDHDDHHDEEQMEGLSVLYQSMSARGPSSIPTIVNRCPVQSSLLCSLATIMGQHTATEQYSGRLHQQIPSVVCEQ